MIVNPKLFVSLIFLVPFLALSQITPPVHDTTAKTVTMDSLAKYDSAHLAKKDTALAPVAAVKVDCYKQWLEAFHKRGAKTVTDGMQQVVIALKDSESCRCLMGQIEVVGGKMKPPLYFQQENGEYHAVSTVGKKMEPAFAGSVTPEELYSIRDGMSITFRTSDQEYGRLFFFKFVNKSTQGNKAAASPSELIKD